MCSPCRGKKIVARNQIAVEGQLIIKEGQMHYLIILIISWCSFAQVSTEYRLQFETEVSRFLDSDVRPDATVIEKSSAEIAELNEEIVFNGVLGSIKGELLSNFVGFTGLQVPIEYFTFFSKKPKSLNFEISNFKSELEEATLTVQILDLENRTYSRQLKKIEKGIYEISLEDFKLNSRGRLTNQSYDGAKIQSIRFFFQRSENAPNSTRPFRVDLSIQKNSLRVL